jgi:hypothetical protein
MRNDSTEVAPADTAAALVAGIPVGRVTSREVGEKHPGDARYR